MAGTISLREAFDIIKSGGANGEKTEFSCRFVTLDQNRTAKPSKHVYLPRAVECGAKHNLVAHDQIGIKPVDGGHQYAVHMDLLYMINDMHIA